MDEREKLTDLRLLVGFGNTQGRTFGLKSRGVPIQEGERGAFGY